MALTPSQAIAEMERLENAAHEANRALNRPGKRLAAAEKQRRFEAWCAACDAHEEFEADMRSGALDGDAADFTHFPACFSAHRDAPDSIRLEGWNEDGTGEVTISLTHSTAMELVAALAATLAANPYAR